MTKERIKQIAAGSVIAGAALAIYLELRIPTPPFQAEPHQALGQVAAEEALKLAPGQGRVVVFARDQKTFKSPAAAAQLAGFADALARAGRKIAATNLLAVDPLRIANVPPGGFLERLQRGAEGDVIVSFLGPPLLTDDQLRRLGQKRVNVVAVCSGDLPRQVDLRRLFEQKLLHAAIITRLAPLPKPVPGAAPRAWFDSLFQVILPGNLDDLPAYKGPS
jgi:hypothetical protein